jgi:hypothetical protein
MIDVLLKQFTGSAPAQEALSALTAQGLSPAQAEQAVTAAADGAAHALQGDGGGLGDLLGGGAASALGGLLGGGDGGGLAGMLGGLAGGGGLGGMLGGITGGASTGSSSDGFALPPAVVDKVAQFVADKTGLSIDHARMAANVVLPKVVAFVKSKMA